jgi:hypothetical protein
MMALSGASPIQKGEVSAFDTRFNIIEQSVDDRTDEEKNYIAKSRYSSVNYYISNSKKHKKSYNDVKSLLNKEVMEYCKSEA